MNLIFLFLLLSANLLTPALFVRYGNRMVGQSYANADLLRNGTACRRFGEIMTIVIAALLLAAFHYPTTVFYALFCTYVIQFWGGLLLRFCLA